MTTIDSLNWSEPRHGIRTARGTRSLRTANPTPSFWAEWRANKAALQAQGITCDKDDAGNWRVLQWMKPDDATARKPEATISNAGQENGQRGTPGTPRGTTLLEGEPDSSSPEATGKTADQDTAPSGEVALEGFSRRPLDVDASVKWSAEQMAIFKWFNSGRGNLVVQARAGTGKTTTIKQAFAVAPETDMLYAVFNKKNRKEAKSKINDVRVDVMTLHSLGFSFIKSVWRDAQPDDKVEYDRITATVGDVPDDVSGAIEKLVGFAKNLYASPTLGQLEDICRDRDIFTDSEDEEAGGWKADKLARAAIQVMERAKTKDSANRISFNDMVWLPVAMGWARPRYDLVVIDECFVAGTKVKMADGSFRNIESIQPGDEVANAAGCGMVKRVFKKKSNLGLVEVRHEQGGFVCTPNHKVFTNKGWVSACFLNETHDIITHEQTMRILQGRAERGEEAFLQSLLHSEMENEAAGNEGASSFCREKQEALRNSARTVQVESGTREADITQDEDIEPNEINRGEGEDGAFAEINWTQAEDSRRQRNRANQGGIETVAFVPARGEQLRCADKSRKGLSSSLQDRHRIPEDKARSGVRWAFSLRGSAPVCGSEEGGEAKGIRVVGVEIFKQGCANPYAECERGTDVYNISVQGHPSYILEHGEVVHNCQDMNVPQLMMAVKACRKGGRVCVVGDDRQAIYGFRGAAQDGMALMKSKLSAATLGLTVTYRCPKLVVAEAAKLVPDYKAADSAPDGEILDTDQVQLLELAKPGDAVLSRANAPLMSTCLQLLKRGTPARIEGKDIGKQLIGMVRKLKARSVPDFLARLQRWEDKQLNRLKGLKDSETKRAAIRDQRETLTAVAEGCASIAEIEIRIKSLFADSDESPLPAVVLSSVHKAKGLEWDRVFVLSWTFNKRKPKTPADAQEEKNIYYVAVTRAKRQLLRVAEGGQKPNTVTEQRDGTKVGAM